MKAKLFSFILLVLLALHAPQGNGQTPSLITIRSFAAVDGLRPEAAVVEGNDGNFYGTTAYGGPTGDGTVFRISPTGALTTLHNFNFTDGSRANGLVLGSDGNYYGTTYQGGAGDGGKDDEGTVFKITPTGAFTILRRFTGSVTDGSDPNAPLIEGRDGSFYGTTETGGANDEGTVYRITPSGAFTILHSFSAFGGNGINTDGVAPAAALVQAKDGNFFGTTARGGAHGVGTVFKITPAGVLTSLFSFGSTTSVGTYPNAALIEGTDGNFYGTTTNGGKYGEGTIFKITPGGSLTYLHDFYYAIGDGTNAEGAFPNAGLLLGKDGNFYGTASFGGLHHAGTIFKVTPAGAFTTVHSFAATGRDANGSPQSVSGLVLSDDGVFYGTTNTGGTSYDSASGTGSDGTVFKITQAGAFTTLHRFAYQGGTQPGLGSALVQGSDGNFYGTTYDGGTQGAGTVYKITASGAAVTLHEFADTRAEGGGPEGALVPGSDGNFYGTTFSGGSADTGTVFKITPAGALTTLHSFSSFNSDYENSDGANPVGALVQGHDGNFYGTTSYGGGAGGGTVYKITPAGALTTLHPFNALDTDDTNSDGRSPAAGLIEGSDGNLYGTASHGGTAGTGTVFQITSAGGFKTLHSFTNLGAGGDVPEAALVQGSDGSFYGTTTGFYTGGYGTVFKITSAGSFTNLHGFTSNGTDGATPTAALIRNDNGNFYGTTVYGGDNDNGTIFEITPAGVVTTVHNFADSGTDGSYPGASLARGRDGGYYGTTQGGGAAGAGTVFKIGDIPAITNAATVTATQGKVFSYQIAANNHPTSFGVAGLPPGLHVDGKTGLISGTPTVSGKKTLTLKAANAFGSSTAVLTLTIVAAPPLITSPKTATATVGKAFSYQITATNNPTSYGVLGLPPGLKVDGKTGLITGTLTTSGTKSLMLKAANATGVGQETLMLTIKSS